MMPFIALPYNYLMIMDLLILGPLQVDFSRDAIEHKFTKKNTWCCKLSVENVPNPCLYFILYPDNSVCLKLGHVCLKRIQVVHVEGKYEHGKPSYLHCPVFRPILPMTLIIVSLPSKHKFHPPAKNGRLWCVLIRLVCTVRVRDGCGGNLTIDYHNKLFQSKENRKETLWYGQCTSALAKKSWSPAGMFPK